MGSLETCFTCTWMPEMRCRISISLPTRFFSFENNNFSKTPRITRICRKKNASVYLFARASEYLFASVSVWVPECPWLYVFPMSQSVSIDIFSRISLDAFMYRLSTCWSGWSIFIPPSPYSKFQVISYPIACYCKMCLILDREFINRWGSWWIDSSYKSAPAISSERRWDIIQTWSGLWCFVLFCGKRHTQSMVMQIAFWRTMPDKVRTNNW